MKKLRIFSMVVFVIAAASFGYFKYEQINSKDNQAPAITMDTDSIQVSCQAEDGELLKGIKATDSKDGDVTGSLIVESVSNFMENHTRNMTNIFFDRTSAFCDEYTGDHGNAYLFGCAGWRYHWKDYNVQ